jgi:hypothetical protein
MMRATTLKAGGLEVRDGTGDTRIDLAWDARMRPPVATDLGTVLHEDELAADKLLAVFGRAEARDFLDVYGLSQRLGWEPPLCLLRTAAQVEIPRHGATRTRACSWSKGRTRRRWRS